MASKSNAREDIKIGSVRDEERGVVMAGRKRIDRGGEGRNRRAEKSGDTRIIVIGDVMLDVSWHVYNKGQYSTTSQFHGGIVAQYLKRPDWKTEMLGGAATVARRIISNSSFNGKVIIAGGWRQYYEKDTGKERDRLLSLIPELWITEDKRDDTISKNIEFSRIANYKHDVIKWRIYSSSSGNIKLEQRFDRDYRAPQESFTKGRSEFKVGNNTLVIVTDFNKGLLDIQKIRGWINRIKNTKWFLFRPKRRIGDEIINSFPWNILLPNRSDLAYLLSESPLPPEVMKKVKNRIVFHPKFLMYCSKLQKKLNSLTRNNRSMNGDRFVVIKLDKEGAALLSLNKGKITPFCLDEQSRGVWVGISAGDVLIADLAVHLASDNSSKDEYNRLVAALSRAIKYATAYCYTAENIDNEEIKWYGRVFNKKTDNFVGRVFFVQDPKKVSSNLGDCQEEYIFYSGKRYNDAESLLDKLVKEGIPLKLYQAKWALENFLTVNEGLISDITQFRQKAENYIFRRGYKDRPFVTALCGSPGTGKSSLAEALAEALRCPFIETNVAQWAGIEDLFFVCEQVRNTQIVSERVPLVFLDEVDAQINNQYIYGKLLAPLWDGFYLYRGNRRDLGPVIFLLAGSSKYWRDTGKLLGKLPGNISKLEDLRSRFRTKPIQIPSLMIPKGKRNTKMRVDVLFLIAYHIKRRFPNVQRIDERVFKLLIKGKPTYGIRSIVQVINTMDLIEEEGSVKFRDINGLNIDDFTFHISGVRGIWNAIKGRGNTKKSNSFLKIED